MFYRNENVKLEIERLKKELKQSKKSTISEKASEDIVEEDAPVFMQPVTADTSVLMDELMAGTRRNQKKNHSSHSNKRESQV